MPILEINKELRTSHPEQDFEHRLQLLHNWEEPQGFVQKISGQAS